MPNKVPAAKPRPKNDHHHFAHLIRELGHLRHKLVEAGKDPEAAAILKKHGIPHKFADEG